jgi:ubiquinone/menaquinone biosynthesis C-methylase UbiE
VDSPPFPVLARRDFLQARLEIPYVVFALGLPRGARVLEVECGQGNALVPLARLCAPRRLVGLDVDGHATAAARRRVEEAGVEAEILEGDVRRLPFPGAAFDVVVDFGTCYHIARPEQALREIARVLAPGGRLVHETPLGQLLSHPFRSTGRRLPWAETAELRPHRHAGMFASRVKVTSCRV